MDLEGGGDSLLAHSRLVLAHYGVHFRVHFNNGIKNKIGRLAVQLLSFKGFKDGCLGALKQGVCQLEIVIFNGLAPLVLSLIFHSRVRKDHC